MYHEVWRIERDFFYDPNYHGLNLQAAEKKYEPYLDSISSRDELNHLFQEMLGELTIGHLFAAGGDSPEVKHVRYRIAGRRLQDRKRPLSFRARLQRRELESSAQGPAHATGSQRSGRRISAGRQWPDLSSQAKTSTAFSKTLQASRWF